jgi:glycosyltransferase involved in cell wall biosynthesis
MARLTFVTGWLFHGGAERHAVGLANRLAERGHDCHFVYVKPEATQLERLRLPDGASVRSLDAARYLDPGALRRFATHLSRSAPGAIVAANGYALMYAWLALRLARRRLPLIATFHSTRVRGAKEWLQMLAYRPLFWTASCAVFVSERQRRHWRRRGLVSRRTEVIHNGVDTEAFRDRWSAAERGALRARLGLRESDYVIGLSALLRPEKNHLQLVDAVAALRARGIPARALMIGDGERRAAVEARARELGIAGDIVITGLQQDVRPCVAACDVVALCSLTEAFSLAAIEAMALSRPVVHSDVGGAAEMIDPGHNGFLFPVGDGRALVDRLSILADRGVSARMGRNAREVVERRFSERTMVDRYERLVLELAGPGAAGAPVHPDHAGRAETTQRGSNMRA